ncbi:uncharacterized protein LOC120614244 isoform X8 [Pteropus medius]|uniref:uncharacterized protein LOC120614244 isoform X8 n=1 Tax=Pteropus vampyrus TaxID=132908 RepID=UPI00196A9A32|nr:uncharacterized protein LOC120614244 isoform X8 [Pteropus giganteus]
MSFRQVKHELTSVDVRSIFLDLRSPGSAGARGRRMLLEHAGWQNRVIQGTGAGWLCEQSNPFSKAVKLESQFSPFGRKWRFEDGGLPCFKERERHQRQHQQARRRVSGPAPLRRDRGSRDPVFHASHPDCRVHASYPLKAKQYSGHTSARIRKLRHRDVNYLWKAPQLLSGRAGSEPRKGRTNPACPMEAALSVYYSEEQSVFSLTQEDSNEKTKRKRPVTVFPNSQVGTMMPLCSIQPSDPHVHLVGTLSQRKKREANDSSSFPSASQINSSTARVIGKPKCFN